MANIPVNFGGVILTAGNSITGSFSGMQSLGTGSINNPTGSNITAFKFALRFDSNRNIVEGTAGSITLPAGVSIPLTITSASLSAGSAPILFFT